MKIVRQRCWTPQSGTSRFRFTQAQLLSGKCNLASVKSVPSRHVVVSSYQLQLVWTGLEAMNIKALGHYMAENWTQFGLTSTSLWGNALRLLSPHLSPRIFLPILRLPKQQFQTFLVRVKSGNRIMETSARDLRWGWGRGRNILLYSRNSHSYRPFPSSRLCLLLWFLFWLHRPPPSQPAEVKTELARSATALQQKGEIRTFCRHHNFWSDISVLLVFSSSFSSLAWHPMAGIATYLTI